MLVFLSIETLKLTHIRKISFPVVTLSSNSFRANTGPGSNRDTRTGWQTFTKPVQQGFHQRALPKYHPKSCPVSLDTRVPLKFPPNETVFGLPGSHISGVWGSIASALPGSRISCACQPETTDSATTICRIERNRALCRPRSCRT